jgi:hypothetical protein
VEDQLGWKYMIIIALKASKGEIGQHLYYFNMCANKTFGKKIQEEECPKYHQSMRKQTIENIKYSSYLLQHKTHASKVYQNVIGTTTLTNKPNKGTSIQFF